MKCLGLVTGVFAAIAFQGSAVGQTPTLDVQACVASGGHTERFGKAQFLYCVKPLRDAGKACVKKTDCLGECLTDYGLPDGRAASGRCQAVDEPLRGCFTRLDIKGKAISLCVD